MNQPKRLGGSFGSALHQQPTKEPAGEAARGNLGANPMSCNTTGLPECNLGWVIIIAQVHAAPTEWPLRWRSKRPAETSQEQAGASKPRGEAGAPSNGGKMSFSFARFELR